MPKRIIRSSQVFEKNLVKFLKKNPELSDKISTVFSQLQNDPHHTSLKTHKLHGELSYYLACHITYSYRLIFSFDDECIYPHGIGTHDEVY